MEDEKVEVIQIWMPIKDGGEAYHFGRKQNLKLVATIANGSPLKLDDGFVMERLYKSSRELVETKERLTRRGVANRRRE